MSHTCGYCSESFEPFRADQKYCSDACRRGAGRKARAERAAEAHLQTIKGFENRQYLDGAKLVDWLRREYPESMADVSGIWGEAVARRIWEWENAGDPVHYSSADRILCQMCIVLDLEVPDDCWIEGRNHHPKARPNVDRSKRSSAERRAKGLEMIRQGKTYREVADELGVASSTVRKWKEKAAKKAKLDPFAGLEFCERSGDWVRPQVAA